VISLIKKYPLAAFFILAYLGSWIGWSPWWLSLSGIGLLPYELSMSAIAGINQLGMIAGPLAAAFLVTRIADGREGLKKFQARFTQWRVKPFWYVLALVLVPLAVGIGYFLIPGASFSPEGGVAVVSTLITTYFIYILGGPIQEEPGWRGFALPRLQEKLHPIKAALILGVVHCFWHTPLFFTREWDTARSDAGQLLAYLVLVVSMSFVMSWIANGAKGSILLSILGHNGVNWALFTVAILTGSLVITNWPAAIGMATLALIALIVTRGRLGYTPNVTAKVSL